METLYFLQHYWWALVSLLGALLVFLLFVQGGQTLLFSFNKEDEKQWIINLFGHKWEITFTTLVTFGGAAFASFPLFYSTSFGGAYWLWLSILLLFVLQAVSYEFRNKLSNLLGKRTYDWFLFLNGLLGPFLLGVAVATLFTGGSYYMDKLNITNSSAPIISYWANDYKGLDALANPINILLGLVLVYCSRTLGLLYVLNNRINMPLKESKVRLLLKINGLVFVVLFVLFLIILLYMTGYSVEANGVIKPEKFKYLFNFIELIWPIVLLLLGVLFVLAGLCAEMFNINVTNKRLAFYITSLGVVLAVFPILIVATFNNTAYFPSLVSLQDSLTLFNSSSSLFTLKVMSYVSIAIPFVLAYIVVVWRKMRG